jgi:SRSO17 transposase
MHWAYPAMPKRWAEDQERRDAAGIPADLEFATKPQLAMQQLQRLMAAGLLVRWVAFDEVYGRSEQLRKEAARAGLAYAAIIPCDYLVSTGAGTTIRAEQAVADAVFERRSAGNGSKGPRYADWAMTATGIGGQYLLIRRLICRPQAYTFYLCWAPPGRPATMTYFITIAGRRWPVEETFKTGKDTFGWDQSQTRSFNGICRHTALAALAQLRCAAIRGALTDTIGLPDPDPVAMPSHPTPDDPINDADLHIPLGDAPVLLIGSLDEHVAVTDDAGELAGGGWFVGAATVTTKRPSRCEPAVSAGSGSAR